MIQQRFEIFHNNHPEVYQYLLELIQAVQDKGFNRYGIGALWERLRWHFEIERDEDEFKLNDHYRSRYARKIMEDHPELAGFFEIRKLRAA